MFTKLVLWNRRRLFNKAYRILRREADRHQNAEHDMYFVAVNESHVIMSCANCPELQPLP